MLIAAMLSCLGYTSTGCSVWVTERATRSSVEEHVARERECHCLLPRHSKARSGSAETYADFCRGEEIQIFDMHSLAAACEHCLGVSRPGFDAKLSTWDRVVLWEKTAWPAAGSCGWTIPRMRLRFYRPENVGKLYAKRFEVGELVCERRKRRIKFTHRARQRLREAERGRGAACLRRDEAWALTP